MNNWKVIFATAVIFGAGVVTGGLLVNYVTYSHPRNNFRHPAATAEVHPPATNQLPHLADAPKPRLPEILSKDFVEKLEGELQLAPEQRAAIEKIIAEGQGEMQKSVQAVRQETRRKVRDQFTPEQQAQFDFLMKRPQKKAAPTTNVITVLPPQPLTTNAP